LRSRYGLAGENEMDAVRIDDQNFLERHHSIVTKKLEEKMNELTLYAETLSRKNRELTSSESRYRGLFEHAIEPIFVLDNKVKKIVDVNKKGEGLLGCMKEEILKLDTLPLTIGDCMIPDIYNIKKPFKGEAVLKTKDGNILNVDITSGPINLHDESMSTLLFVRDVTEQKRMREQMFQAEKMSTMGRIAAGIAHEIRNPLAGISLNLQFLERHLTTEGLDRDSVMAGLEGVARIQQVIEDTLGLARVAPPAFQKHSLNPLIEKVISYIRVSLRNKNIRLHSSLGENIPGVMIDANQIQQVLLNAFQNAIDASPESGTIEIKTTVELHNEHEPARYAVIALLDSGPGLSKNIVEHLFEPFRTTKTDGTGLGLMLSKYIIDRHEGKISIINTPHGGALVRIYLPIQ
jgi:PAS domain S-box-containing protein